MNHAAKLIIISHITKLFPIFFISNQSSFINNQSSLPSTMRSRAHGAQTIAHSASNTCDSVASYNRDSVA